MSQELNRHILGRYRDGLKMVQFCQVCGKEELELHQSECKGVFGELSTEKAIHQSDNNLPTEENKKEFVSGLPEKD